MKNVLERTHSAHGDRLAPAVVPGSDERDVAIALARPGEAKVLFHAPQGWAPPAISAKQAFD
jgi:hypothetical protein